MGGARERRLTLRTRGFRDLGGLSQTLGREWAAVVAAFRPVVSPLFQAGSNLSSQNGRQASLQFCNEKACQALRFCNDSSHLALTRAIYLMKVRSILFLGLACLTIVAADNCRAQDAADRIIVRGEEIPSAYGAPPGISRTRFAPLTTAYVLPPDSIYTGFIYEVNSFDHGPSDHTFTEEIEMGLPHRFGVAAEVAQESFDGEFQNKLVSLETRYALADWNKIPLNPTVFFEWKFGSGRVLHEEGGEEEGKKDEERLTGDGKGGGKGDEEGAEEEERPKLPNAYEFRLLLSQDFAERFEWALNGFFEQEVSGDKGREWGFAQSAVTPVLLPNERLRVGVEMQYKNFTNKFTRDDPTESVVIGPTIAWKPTRNTRIDVSPLFGVTHDAPEVQAFAVFSVLFGPEAGGEGPASTRNR